MNTLRIINGADVRTLLSMKRCITLMRHAMALVPKGETIQPIRSAVHHPSGRGLLSLMPGYTANPDWLGVKIVTVFPGNFATEFGSHQGMVLLFEPQHGRPVAVIDGREITAIRTAAASAVATDALANPDCQSLGIYGYGDQAHAHLHAITTVRTFNRIQIWGRNPDQARAFAAEQSEQLQLPIEVAATAEDVATADVICTATAAAQPFFKSTWLRPGHHLNVVGSSIPTTSEIDVETVARSRYFVDFKDSALALAGDFRAAKAAGLVNDDHILGSVGDVLIGRVQGRTSASDITLFKSLGMIAEDLISCDHVLREAAARNVGSVVEF